VSFFCVGCLDSVSSFSNRTLVPEFIPPVQENESVQRNSNHQTLSSLFLDDEPVTSTKEHNLEQDLLLRPSHSNVDTFAQTKDHTKQDLEPKAFHDHADAISTSHDVPDSIPGRHATQDVIQSRTRLAHPDSTNASKSPSEEQYLTDSYHMKNDKMLTQASHLDTTKDTINQQTETIDLSRIAQTLTGTRDIDDENSIRKHTVEMDLIPRTASRMDNPMLISDDPEQDNHVDPLKNKSTDPFSTSAIRPWLQVMTIAPPRGWQLDPMERLNVTIGSAKQMICKGMDIAHIQFQAEGDFEDLESDDLFRKERFNDPFTISFNNMMIKCVGSFNGTYHGHIFHPYLSGELEIVLNATTFAALVETEHEGDPSLPSNFKFKQCTGDIAIEHLTLTPGNFAIKIIELFHNVLRRHFNEHLPNLICQEFGRIPLKTHLNKKLGQYIRPVHRLTNPGLYHDEHAVDLQSSPLVDVYYELLQNAYMLIYKRFLKGYVLPQRYLSYFNTNFNFFNINITTVAKSMKFDFELERPTIQALSENNMMAKFKMPRISVQGGVDFEISTSDIISGMNLRDELGINGTIYDGIIECELFAEVVDISDKMATVRKSEQTALAQLQINNIVIDARWDRLFRIHFLNNASLDKDVAHVFNLMVHHFLSLPAWSVVAQRIGSPFIRGWLNYLLAANLPKKDIKPSDNEDTVSWWETTSGMLLLGSIGTLCLLPCFLLCGGKRRIFQMYSLGSRFHVPMTISYGIPLMVISSLLLLCASIWNDLGWVHCQLTVGESTLNFGSQGQIHKLNFGTIGTLWADKFYVIDLICVLSILCLIIRNVFIIYAWGGPKHLWRGSLISFVHATTCVPMLLIFTMFVANVLFSFNMNNEINNRFKEFIPAPYIALRVGIYFSYGLHFYMASTLLSMIAGITLFYYEYGREKRVILRVIDIRAKEAGKSGNGLLETTIPINRYSESNAKNGILVIIWSFVICSLIICSCFHCLTIKHHTLPGEMERFEKTHLIREAPLEISQRQFSIFTMLLGDKSSAVSTDYYIHLMYAVFLEGLLAIELLCHLSFIVLYFRGPVWRLSSQCYHISNQLKGLSGFPVFLIALTVIMMQYDNSDHPFLALNKIDHLPLTFYWFIQIFDIDTHFGQIDIIAEKSYYILITTTCCGLLVLYQINLLYRCRRIILPNISRHDAPPIREKEKKEKEHLQKNENKALDIESATGL